MCTDFETAKEKELIGYKAVAKHRKTGKYYSVLTGNKYPDKDTDMPVWCSQKNMMVHNLSQTILPGDINHHRRLLKHGSPEGCIDYRHWNKEQIGKTGAFAGKYKCLRYADYLNSSMWRHERKNFYVVIVEVKLTKELVHAKLGDDEVFCGKRMEILKEVETYQYV